MEAGGGEWGRSVGKRRSWVKEKYKEAGWGGHSRVGGTWPWVGGLIDNNDE